MNTFEEELRYSILQGALTRVARVCLRQKSATVSVTFGTLNSPAWSLVGSSGTAIWLNRTFITMEDVRGLSNIYGLLYHEIGHALFTPRTLLSKVSRNRGDVRSVLVLNLLEDQRMERLVISKWPRTKGYLTAACQRWVISAAPGSAHLLLHGRTYLPKEVRDLARGMFDFPSIRDRAEEIIEAYCELGLPRDMDLALALIKELRDLLYGADCPIPTNHRCAMQESGLPTDPGEGEDRQQELQQRAKEQGEQEEQSAEDAECPSSVTVVSNEEFKKLAHEALNRAVEEAPTRKEMQAKLRSFQQHTSPYHMPDSISPKKAIPIPPSPDARRADRAFRRELLLLSDAGGAAWERRTSSGRLNPTRALDPRTPLDEAFDEWSEEGEGHDLDVVSLIDASASMQDVMGQVSEMAWMIDSGIRSVGGEHLSFSFSHSAQVLYQRGTPTPRLVPQVGASGGTLPIGALVQARAALLSSKRKNRLLIILTDGEWDPNSVGECEEIIRELNASGVHTALAYLDTGTGGLGRSSHQCLEFQQVDRVSELPKWASSVVSASIQRRLRR